VVITDPPRDGMHKDVIAQLLKLAPKRKLYTSVVIVLLKQEILNYEKKAIK